MLKLDKFKDLLDFVFVAGLNKLMLFKFYTEIAEKIYH